MMLSLFDVTTGQEVGAIQQAGENAELKVEREVKAESEDMGTSERRGASNPRENCDRKARASPTALCSMLRAGKEQSRPDTNLLPLSCDS